MANDLVVQNMAGLKSLAERSMGDLIQLLPKNKDPKRFMLQLYYAAWRNPKLLQCTQQSIVKCFLTAADLDLDISEAYAEAHLVPFKNSKKSVVEAVLIPGWRGVKRKAEEHPDVSMIYPPQVVYSGDRFEYQQGDCPRIMHSPTIDRAKRGEVLCAYAVAKLKNGTVIPAIVTKDEIEDLEKQHWLKSDFYAKHKEAFWKKTAVKRLCKYLPQANGLKQLQAVISEEVPEGTPEYQPAGDDEGLAYESIEAEYSGIASKAVEPSDIWDMPTEKTDSPPTLLEQAKTIFKRFRLADPTKEKMLVLLFGPGAVLERLKDEELDLLIEHMTRLELIWKVVCSSVMGKAEREKVLYEHLSQYDASTLYDLTFDAAMDLGHKLQKGDGKQ